MDSGATPNVMCFELSERLRLQSDQTKKVLTFAIGHKSDVLRKMTDIPVLFGMLEEKIGFFILQNVPFEIISESPVLRRFGGLLDFKTEKMRLEYRC